jgi:hypothetical protein
VDEEPQNPNEELGEICHYRMRKHEKIPINNSKIFPYCLYCPPELVYFSWLRAFGYVESATRKKKKKKKKKRKRGILSPRATSVARRGC